MTAIFILLIAPCSYVLVGYIVGCDPWFFLRPRVYLVDYEDDIYKSRLYRGMTAYVYPATQIGEVHLNDDGTVRGSSYINRWYKK